MENLESMPTAQEPVFETPGFIPSIQSKQVSNQVRLAGKGEMCPSCAASKDREPNQYIYSIGLVQPRFPSLGIEKEFAQISSRQDTSGFSDSRVMHQILSDDQNRYLARKLCWILTIEGLETYILQPMDTADLDMLIESLRPKPRPGDINVVIGTLGPLAQPQYCNGLQLPIVGFDQLYSFDVDTLIQSIPKPEKIAPETFEPLAEELFTRIIQMTDNAGAADDHRTLNYLAVRYHAIYATAADCYTRNFSLTGVEVRHSGLSIIRKIMDAIFTFSNRSTDVSEKYYCRVDVTEEFPFLVTKLQPYVDR
jgi:PatG Domain